MNEVINGNAAVATPELISGFESLSTAKVYAPDGRGAPGRRAFPLSPEKTIRMVNRAGFELMRRSEASSAQAGSQAGGVRWTWLTIKKVC